MTQLLVKAPVVTAGGTIGRHGVLVAGATVAVSAISYCYGIVLAHVMSSADYSVFAAGQTLLLLAGTVSAAAIPWALARAVRRDPAGSRARQEAMSYAFMMSSIGAVVFGAVLFAVTVSFAPSGAALAIGCATAGVVVSGSAVGWLQGELRFTRLAALRVSEVAIRVVVGFVAIGLGLGAGGALGAFVLGSVLLLIGGFTAGGWDDVHWYPTTLKDRWRWNETVSLAGVQLALAVLTGADIVLAPILSGAGTASGSYQLAATLGRSPLFVASALAVVLFPRLVGAEAGAAIRETLGSFSWLAFPGFTVLLTVPWSVLKHLVPGDLHYAANVLPATAVAGMGYAGATLAVTVLQGYRRYRKAAIGAIVGSALLLLGLIAGWSVAGVTGLAYGGAGGSMSAGGLLLALSRRDLPRRIMPVLAGPAAFGTTSLLLLSLSRIRPALWIGVAAAVSIVALCQARRGRDTSPYAGPRLRILHLGFEDPIAPNAGGGSHRTHEINRRLAARYDITVLTTRWPGCVDRVEDGVRYVHVGIGAGRGYFRRIVAYALVLPFVTRKYPSDLVVEDFFAPVSSISAPVWTRRPTVGNVQWLNAREKSRQYRLPFFLVERIGVRTHRRMIAMSDDLAVRLRTMNPRARIDVVGNGVDPLAFAVEEPDERRGILYIGRLEINQKGLDLLLDSYALLDRTMGRLTIAGTGPDEAKLRAHAHRLGIADRVDFIGWVGGQQKFELIASALIVAMPSRFETFGIVAVESLACGTPVVAFEIDCLRAVVPESCGYRVDAFDVNAFADRLGQLMDDEDMRSAMGRCGRRFARTFTWEKVAQDQEAAYLMAIAQDARATAHQGTN